jgi:hypothetical protein
MTRKFPEFLDGIEGLRYVRLPRYRWVVLYHYPVSQELKGLIKEYLENEGYGVAPFGDGIYIVENGRNQDERNI